MIDLRPANLRVINYQPLLLVCETQIMTFVYFSFKNTYVSAIKIENLTIYKAGNTIKG